jgi:hypothetical protein
LPWRSGGQRVIGAALRRTYLWFARKAFLITVFLLVLSIPLKFLPAAAP